MASAFREPCECGDCPRLPTDRPATLEEHWQYHKHHFGEFAHRRSAAGAFCYQYQRWVIWRGWRKPPGWSPDEKVALHELRPNDRSIDRDKFQTWVRVVGDRFAGGDDVRP